MPRTRSIIVNGRPLHIALPEETISYDELCDAAGVEGSGYTVTYSLPDGRSGCPKFGEECPLVDGAIYNVMRTGNA